MARDNKKSGIAITADILKIKEQIIPRIKGMEIRINGFFLISSDSSTPLILKFIDPYLQIVL